MAVYEIPTTPSPTTLQVQFPNGTTYTLRLIYLFTPNDCWELDVGDQYGNPIVQGIPLITGADLLAQYGYLGFGCSMYCTVDGGTDSVPKFFNLGSSAKLWLEA